MEDTRSKIYLNWHHVEALLDILIHKTKPEFTSVMGVPRGGLILAVIISHRLNIPLVFEPTSTTLIVDDICDSGDTFYEIHTKYHLLDLKFACLYYKSHTSKFIPNIYSVEYLGNSWIVYPWERDDSETIQDYLK